MKIKIEKTVGEEKIEITFKRGWLDIEDHVRFKIIGYTKYKNKGFEEHEKMTTWNWGNISFLTGEIESEFDEHKKLIVSELLKVKDKFAKKNNGD